MGFLPVTPLLYMDFANITTAMPGRAPQQPLLFQATPNADVYGLAGEVQPMAAAVAWTQPTAGDLNGTVIRPPTVSKVVRSV